MSNTSSTQSGERTRYYIVEEYAADGSDLEGPRSSKVATLEEARSTARKWLGLDSLDGHEAGTDGGTYEGYRIVEAYGEYHKDDERSYGCGGVVICEPTA